MLINKFKCRMHERKKKFPLTTAYECTKRYNETEYTKIEFGLQYLIEGKTTNYL